MKEARKIPYKEPGKFAQIAPVLMLLGAILFVFVAHNGACVAPRHSGPWSNGQCLGFSVFMAFVLGSAGVFGLLNRWTAANQEQQVLVEHDAISAPAHGIRSGLVKIQFSDFRHVEVTSRGHGKVLCIYGRHDTLKIPRDQLLRDEDFDWLEQRMKAVSEGSSTRKVI